MAFEDLITRPTPGMLSGLGEAVSQGFELAKAKQQIQAQQEAVKLQRLKVTDEAMDSIVKLIPQIQSSKGGEKKFKINGMKQYASVANLDIPDEFFDYLEKSEGTAASLSEYVKAAQAASDDPAVQVALVIDKMKQAGRNPLEAQPLFNLFTARERANTATKIAQAKREEITQEAYRKAKLESGASGKFITDLDAMKDLNLDQKNLILSQRKVAMESIKSITDKMLQPTIGESIPESRKTAIAEIKRLALENLDNPATVEAGAKMARDLDAMVLKATGEGQAQAGEVERKRKDSEFKIKLFQAERSLAKDVRNNNKPVVEALDTSARVMNILNDPEVSRTAVGADAIISLLARWIDPRTGVREAEQQRIANAAAGGVLAKVEKLGRWIKEGNTLDAEQRGQIAALVNLELRAARKRVATLKKSIEKQAKGIGSNADDVLALAGFADVPGDFKAENIPADLFKKDEKSKKTWFDRVKENVSLRAKEKDPLDESGQATRGSSLISEDGSSFNPAAAPSYHSGESVEAPPKPQQGVSAKSSTVSSLKSKLFKGKPEAAQPSAQGTAAPVPGKVNPDSLKGQEFLDYLMGK